MLIDGRSGTGKTTFARRLAAVTGYRLVQLDEFYPGWYGLAAGAATVAEQVLDPDRPGFTRWDWERDGPGESVALRPGESLIIDGAGAVTAASISAAQRLGGVLSVRMTAPAALRRHRSLSREPSFAPWWRAWAEQEDRHFAGAGSVPVDVTLASANVQGHDLGHEN